MSMISIVVNIYNMRREAARTLYTLSHQYQRDIKSSEYEVIVVENGSTDPVGKKFVERYGNNFHYIDMSSKSHPSPVNAINEAVSIAKGKSIGIILDGARMATPRLLAAARDALRINPKAVACTLAWHLGNEHQSISASKGYSQQSEDLMLESLEWEIDGYRLFDRAAWAFSNPEGHFGFLAESCATFLSKCLFDSIQGYDPAFVLPGGGYANLDFFKRCCEAEGANVILLAGEGTFHQYHGGATTGPLAAEYGTHASNEYQSIRGHHYNPPQISPTFFGRFDPHILPWLRRSLECTLYKMPAQ